MKKTYIDPQLNVMLFDMQDIVTASVALVYNDDLVDGMSINDLYNS
ncbi:MAG: hypothetical protein IJW55_09975 [Clostridia bacterium]|nr:hypothetical protein [Clostridia bacterium]MBQ7348274.1 hypothetical protein [Clostridia bacterium]